LPAGPIPYLTIARRASEKSRAAFSREIKLGGPPYFFSRVAIRAECSSWASSAKSCSLVFSCPIKVRENHCCSLAGRIPSPLRVFLHFSVLLNSYLFPFCVHKPLPRKVALILVKYKTRSPNSILPRPVKARLGKAPGADAADNKFMYPAVLWCVGERPAAPRPPAMGCSSAFSTFDVTARPNQKNKTGPAIFLK